MALSFEETAPHPQAQEGQGRIPAPSEYALGTPCPEGIVRVLGLAHPPCEHTLPTHVSHLLFHPRDEPDTPQTGEWGNGVSSRTPPALQALVGFPLSSTVQEPKHVTATLASRATVTPMSSSPEARRAPSSLARLRAHSKFKSGKLSPFFTAPEHGGGICLETAVTQWRRQHQAALPQAPPSKATREPGLLSYRTSQPGALGEAVRGRGRQRDSPLQQALHPCFISRGAETARGDQWAPDGTATKMATNSHWPSPPSRVLDPSLPWGIAQVHILTATLQNSICTALRQ